MSFFRKLRRSKKPSDLWVSLMPKEDITPEDIFSDASSSLYKNDEEKKLEISINPWTTRFLFFSIYALLIFLAFYTIFISMTRNEEALILAEKNSQRVYEIGHSRGDIISSDGEVLATSSSGFDIILNPTNITKEEIENLSEAFSQSDEEVVYEYLYDRIISAKEKKLGSLIILKNLKREELSGFRYLLDAYEELSINEHSLRVYRQDNVFSHILGYIAPVTEDDLLRLPQYDLLDNIGKKGIEYYFEPHLRGESGLFAKFVSAQGDIIKEEIIRSTEVGDTIKLTVDSKLQKATRDILREALEENKLTSGAAIVMNPNNGRILALVSLPDFNPNHFAYGLTNNQVELYFNNRNNPLFNRVTSGKYATGSVIKPIIASAALEEGIISPNKYLFTQGYIAVPSVYDPSIIYRFNDWKNHGAVNMRDAIAVSSNVYFYTIGGGYKDQEGLGIYKIAEYLEKFNWGSKLGINFSSESIGLVPTPEWKEEVKNENWQIGDTYNVSIGQGDVLATPLQVISSIASFANKGTIYKPYIVEEIYSQDGIVQSYNNGDIINDKFLSQETIQVVREGMRMAVTSGSSQFLSQLPVEVAGKTGTAQTSGKEANAWFTGFAPYNNPEIIVTVILEEGETSNNAVRAAYRIFKEYFAN